MAKGRPKKTPMADALDIAPETPTLDLDPILDGCAHQCSQEDRIEILERIVGCLGQGVFSHAPGIPKPDRVKANRLKEGLREQYYKDREK